jgi:hypothetical protein
MSVEQGREAKTHQAQNPNKPMWRPRPLPLALHTQAVGFIQFISI